MESRRVKRAASRTRGGTRRERERNEKEPPRSITLLIETARSRTRETFPVNIENERERAS